MKLHNDVLRFLICGLYLYSSSFIVVRHPTFPNVSGRRSFGGFFTASSKSLISIRGYNYFYELIISAKVESFSLNTCRITIISDANHGKNKEEPEES